MDKEDILKLKPRDLAQFMFSCGKSGDVESLRFLFSQKDHDSNIFDCLNRSVKIILFNACSIGHFNVVKFIGENFNDFSLSHCLIEASKNNHNDIFNYLVDKYQINKLFSFKLACQGNNIDLVKGFLHNCDLTKSIPEIIQINYNAPAALDYLFKHLAENIDELDYFELRMLKDETYSLIDRALKNKDTYMMEYFFMSDNIRSLIDIEKATEVFIGKALDTNDADIIDFFLVDLEKLDKELYSDNNKKMLFEAIKSDNFEAVEYLLYSPDLKKHVDIQDGKAYKLALMQNAQKTIELIVSDPSLMKTQTIRKISIGCDLSLTDNNLLDRILKTRKTLDRYHTLEESVSHKTDIKPKRKI